MTKENQSEVNGQKPLRVLMVEDSEDDALFIIRELEKGGYNPMYEWLNGTGYPRNLKRDKIILEALIMAVADACLLIFRENNYTLAA